MNGLTSLDHVSVVFSSLNFAAQRTPLVERDCQNVAEGQHLNIMNDAGEHYPVAQSVALRLQEKIRSGEFEEGKRLPSQRKLAEEMHVSRTSLREALTNLETLGLIKTYPARGTFVQKPGSRSARDIGAFRFSPATPLAHVFELRAMIEPRLAHSAAVTSTGLDIQRLAALTDRMESSWDTGDLVTHAEADLAFHRHIAESCANRLLVEIYENFRPILMETHRTQIPVTLTKSTSGAIMTKSLRQHREIVAALNARDPAAAARAMKKHIAFAKSCSL